MVSPVGKLTPSAQDALSALLAATRDDKEGLSAAAERFGRRGDLRLLRLRNMNSRSQEAVGQCVAELYAKHTGKAEATVPEIAAWIKSHWYLVLIKLAFVLMFV